jgi:excinuclease ABC subunit B
MGRAARHLDARVIMYADEITPQMTEAIDETERRRAKQIAYNEVHGITPVSIRKAVRRGIEMELKARKTARDAFGPTRSEQEYDREQLIEMMKEEMLEAARNLEFERAAKLRDQVAKLEGLPKYRTDAKIARSDVEDAKPKPGAPRSRAGITTRGGRKANR